MDAVHAGLVQPFQLLGGGDVGQHHELLDQPVAVESRAGRNRRHPPGVVQHDAALRQVEVERAAGVAGGQQGAERGIQGRQRQAEIVAGVVRRLHLLIGEPGGAAHQAAAEAVRRFFVPPASTRISTNRQPRSSPGRRLHQPFDSASGSIGTTRSGK